MKFRKSNNKTIENSEELLNKAYSCKPNELKDLLEEIRAKIKSDGHSELLSRAKSVTTTRIILNYEKNN
ncbi:hypothetical protein [Methanobacterium sp.]|uniref:hypothetical protein n=1 Tax=Methanobacterium sp. TaxID=2164 RepID=UPI003C7186EA